MSLYIGKKAKSITKTSCDLQFKGHQRPSFIFTTFERLLKVKVVFSLTQCGSRSGQGNRRGPRAPNHNKEPGLSSRPNLKREPRPHHNSHSPTEAYEAHKPTLKNTNTHPVINKHRTVSRVNRAHTNTEHVGKVSKNTRLMQLIV